MKVPHRNKGLFRTIKSSSIEKIIQLINLSFVVYSLSSLPLPSLHHLLTTVVYTTLTLNSTTLYITENAKLTHLIPNLNCSELVSQELGIINSSKTLVGLLPVFSDNKVTKATLLLYFMKKTLHGADGGTDLVTVVTLAHQNVNKTLILSVLKKIMDKYFEFRADLTKAATPTPVEMGIAPGSPLLNEELTQAKLGEFKLYMTQIIKFEELQYDTNRSMYRYGSSSSDHHYSDQEPGIIITPNSLVSATEEVEEVRQLMLENINKIFGRGDKLNSLVDQTERLQSSAVMFQKNALTIKRNMRWANIKFFVIVTTIALLLLYLFIGVECGYPFFQVCFK